MLFVQDGQRASSDDGSRLNKKRRERTEHMKLFSIRLILRDCLNNWLIYTILFLVFRKIYAFTTCQISYIIVLKEKVLQK